MPRIILFACSLVEHRKLLQVLLFSTLQSYNKMVEVCASARKISIFPFALHKFHLVRNLLFGYSHGDSRVATEGKKSACTIVEFVEAQEGNGRGEKVRV